MVWVVVTLERGLACAKTIRLLKRKAQPIRSQAEKAGYPPSRNLNDWLFQEFGQRTGDTLPKSYQLVSQWLRSGRKTPIFEMELRLAEFSFLKFAWPIDKASDNLSLPSKRGEKPVQETRPIPASSVTPVRHPSNIRETVRKPICRILCASMLPVRRLDKLIPQIQNENWMEP